MRTKWGQFKRSSENVYPQGTVSHVFSLYRYLAHSTSHYLPHSIPLSVSLFLSIYPSISLYLSFYLPISLYLSNKSPSPYYPLSQRETKRKAREIAIDGATRHK